MSASSSLLVVSYGETPVENLHGYVATHALDPSQRPTLLASSAQLALELGETLTLSLDAGVEHAGRIFSLRGSLSGSSPGTPLGGGMRLPLNLRNDPYAAFARWRGRLDGLGRATVSIALPVIMPGDPLSWLDDRTLHHAFAVWRPGHGVTHVSNVALTGLVGR
jgi:hypothetical protein